MRRIALKILQATPKEIEEGVRHLHRRRWRGEVDAGEGRGRDEAKAERVRR